MKIAVLGTRGFPDVQGGVEAHCQKLYPRLAKIGCEITVFTRRPYSNPELKTYENINLIPLACPRTKSLEAIIHTFRAVWQAKKIRPDILHIHAVGPALLVPLARSLGFKVIMTNHGPDYQRKKWGFSARRALRLGESWGSRWANEIICISEAIAEDIKRRYRRRVNVIPNGVEIPEILEDDTTLRKYALSKGRYLLSVGRFVPEKGLDDLIDAFNQAQLGEWKLVIVGRADHEDKYSRRLREKAGRNRRIVLPGFLSGRPLQELYSHAGLFVLPSHYEGLSIALLEAMSYGLCCLASDIPANRSIGLPAENYFPAEDAGHLSAKLQQFVKQPLSAEQRTRQIEMLRREYNWDEAARRTLEIYRTMLK